MEQKYFTIKLDALIPAEIEYKILATSPEEAIKLVKNTKPKNIKYKINGKIDRLIKVYVYGTVHLLINKLLR